MPFFDYPRFVEPLRDQIRCAAKVQTMVRGQSRQAATPLTL